MSVSLSDASFLAENSPRFTKNSLSVELCPELLGELTALPQTPCWIKGKERSGDE